MSDVLSLSLRPQNFGQVLGQKTLLASIQKQVASGRIPAAWMFVGGSGTGKTTLARIISLSLQCLHQKEFGYPCEDCRKNASQFSIFEINASEVSGVDDIGKIAFGSRMGPIPPSRYRIYLLDEAQLLTTNSQNLLLKPFEDACRTTVWMICTTAPNKILPTLRRRCMTYQLAPLGPKGRRSLLDRAIKSIQFEGEVGPFLDEVDAAGMNSPGMLLMAFERFAAGIPPLEAVQGATASAEAGTIVYAVNAAMTRGDWSKLREQFKKLTPEDSRLLRASAIGWLRGMLLRENNPKKQRMLAQSLLSLLEMAPQDDGLLFPWLLGKLYGICQQMRTVG